MPNIKRESFDMEEEILLPYKHIVPARSGALLYTGLPVSFQYWLRIPQSKLHQIQKIMEMLTNFTYLFDDIQDNSLFRRSVPTAHRVFGIPLTINASIHVFGLALEKTLELDHPEAVNVVLAQTLNVLRGQGADIVWREKNTFPTENEYKKMSEKKSSAMFKLLLDLMQLFSDNKTDFSELIRLFGIYYEIRDDYCNLMKPERLEGRDRNDELQCVKEVTFCEDLTDGKFSYPTIHALRHADSSVITYLLKQRTRDLDLKRLYLDTLNRLGSLQYTREALLEYNQEIRKELARLGGNPEFETILDNFFDWADQ